MHCPTTIDHLPSEILALILTFCNIRTRQNCLLVSRLWYRVTLPIYYSTAEIKPQSTLDLTTYRRHSHHLFHLFWNTIAPYLQTNPVCDFLLGVEPRSFDYRNVKEGELRQLDTPLWRTLTFRMGADVSHQYYRPLWEFLERQQELRSITFLGPATELNVVPLVSILLNRPNLIHFDAKEYQSKPLDCRGTLWSLDQGQQLEPFQIRTLHLSDLLLAVNDYEAFFQRLPLLESLFMTCNVIQLNQSAVVSLLQSSQKPISFTNKANRVVFASASLQSFSEEFPKLLVRCCPRLKTLELNSLHIRAKFSPQASKDLEEYLPPVMLDFYEGYIYRWEGTLHKILAPLCPYLTVLDLSQDSNYQRGDDPAMFPRRYPQARGCIAGAGGSLQVVLENCPRLVVLKARGWWLRSRDMASIECFPQDPSSPLDAASFLSLGVDDQSQVGYGRVGRPWLCEGTLERLEVGFITTSCHPTEHAAIYAQLGRLQRLSSLLLYWSTLIPSISHGLDRMKHVPIAHLGIKNSLWPAPNKETAAWMMEHWGSTLESVCLDLVNANRQLTEAQEWFKRGDGQRSVLKVYLLRPG